MSIEEPSPVLKNREDLNPTERANYDALLEAIQSGTKQFTLASEQLKAIVNVENDSSNTPLHLAAMHGHEEIALALMKAGAYLNRENAYEETPLHLATMHGHEGVTLALMKAGAYLNTENACEETPLHLAAMHGHEEIALALMKAGATISNSATRHQMYSYEMTSQIARHLLLPAMIQRYPKLLNMDGRKLKNIHDTLTSAVTSVVLPAFDPGSVTLAAYQIGLKKTELNSDATEQSRALEEFITTLRPINKLMRPARLERTWHHPTIGLDATHLPLLTGREWFSLFTPQTVDLDTGKTLTIECLTSGEALSEESAALNHCVGRTSEYANKCLSENPDERSHIITIGTRDKDGRRTPLSTVEVQCIPKSEIPDHRSTNEVDDYVMLPEGNDYALKVLQHYGVGNSRPPEQARMAWRAFGEKVTQGEISLQMDEAKLGETPSSIVRFIKWKPVEQHIGFSKEAIKTHVPKIFEMFKDERRAASIRYRDSAHEDRTGALIYDTGGKKRTGKVEQDATFHFIDGYARLKQDGTPTGEVKLFADDGFSFDKGDQLIRLRHLDFPSWLCATGLEAKMDEIVEKEFSEIKVKKPSRIDLASCADAIVKPSVEIGEAHGVGRITGEAFLMRS